MYSKYDQEEFEGIGDMEKTGHSMKDPLIIHTVSRVYCLNLLTYYLLLIVIFPGSECANNFCCLQKIHFTVKAFMLGGCCPIGLNILSVCYGIKNAIMQLREANARKN